MSSAQWPTSRDYVEAIQSPRICFDDARLKLGQPAHDRFGLPTVTSGQFAYVFKINHPTGDGADAVRCFRSWSHDRELRYRYINLHLDAVANPYLASFEYDPKGIRVRGLLWPTLVMEWIEGHSMDVYLDRVVDNPQALTYLARMWINALRSLRDHGLAHGDLQHGNILIDGASMLRLVDLDGMYVPAMESWSAAELGHRHYQHPARADRHFGATLDNFSGLVIYLSLLALKESPELWRIYHDENLILTKQDFEDPVRSPALSAIRTLGGECARLAGALSDACRDDPMECPSVLDLMAAPSRPKPAWMTEAPMIAVPIATREVRPGAAVVTPTPVAAVPATVSPAATPWWSRPVGTVFGPVLSGLSSTRGFVTRAGLVLGLLMVVAGVFALRSLQSGEASFTPLPPDAAEVVSDSSQATSDGLAVEDAPAPDLSSRNAESIDGRSQSAPSRRSMVKSSGPSASSSSDAITQQATSAPRPPADSSLFARATIGAPRSEADRQAALPAFQRGRDLLGAHRWGEAKRAFREALRLDGSVAAYHAGLGEVLLVEEDWAGAAAEFTAATMIDRNNTDYRARLREAQSRMSR